jgi:tubulin beta
MDIININVGQAGTQIGHHFLSSLATQHQLQDEPAGRPSVFFSQTLQGYHPRAISLDMTSLPQQNTALSFPLKSQNRLASPTPSLGVFAQSRYHWPLALKEGLEDSVRKEAELSDALGGFIVLGSLGGGASSGLTSNALTLVAEQFGTRIAQTFRLLPQLGQHCHPLEIYNTTFAINHEVEFSSMTTFFDNAALTRSVAAAGTLSPSLKDLNRRMGSAIADSTIPFRFAGELNTSQRKLACNLVMFPRMHFLTLAHSRAEESTTSAVFRAASCLLSLSMEEQPDMAIYNMHAGIRSRLLSESEASEAVRRECQGRQLRFKEWIPDNLHLSLHGPVEAEDTTLLFNSEHVIALYRDITTRFTSSFRRKAFIHHYTALGMDEMEFTEAESNLNDLMSEYQPPSPYYEDEDDSEEASEDG